MNEDNSCMILRNLLGSNFVDDLRTRLLLCGTEIVTYTETVPSWFLSSGNFAPVDHRGARPNVLQNFAGPFRTL